MEVFPRLKSDDVVSTSMGKTGEDVSLSTAARKLMRYKIECKSAKKIGIYSMYEQAKNHKGDYEPLLVVKMDRKEPLAIIAAEHFFDMTKELYELRKAIRYK